MEFFDFLAIYALSRYLRNDKFSPGSEQDSSWEAAFQGIQLQLFP